MVLQLRRSPRVVVIGAGLGGLAVALRLQGAGYDVTVVEQRPAPGAAPPNSATDGFTWDTGPSLITMPWVLEETFAAGGLDLHSEVALRRLDPLYRIRWAGEERDVRLPRPPERLQEQIAHFDAARRAPPGRLPGRAAADLRAGDPRRGAARRSPTFASFAALVPAHDAARRRLPLHRFVARHFRHPRVREAFSFHSLFIGGDPFRVPAIYGALVYLQVLDGGWYADGGVYSLVEAMARPLDVRCDARVEPSSTARGGVRAVRLAGGERLPADVVVSNADVLRTHELLGRSPARRRLRPTMSCFLLYLGSDRRFGRTAPPHAARRTRLPPLHPRRHARSAAAAARSRPTSMRRRARRRHGPARRRLARDSAAVPNLRAGIDWEREADGLRDALIADLETTFGLHGLRRVGRASSTG